MNFLASYNNRFSLDSFQKEMDNFFDGFFNLKPGNLPAETWSPTIDLIEKDDMFIVQAEIPGVNESEIDISLEENTLTISGKKSEGDAKEDKEGDIILQERNYGLFQRSFALPKNVHYEHAKADFKNGVLTIELPKKEKESAKQIQINAS